MTPLDILTAIIYTPMVKRFLVCKAHNSSIEYSAISELYTSFYERDNEFQLRLVSKRLADLKRFSELTENLNEN